ncbi:MAG: lamin tail domain-containing protein [Methanophagales archaeon]|nr:lamin tail domain-containing protein [Methanophagales archaeon]
MGGRLFNRGGSRSITFVLFVALGLIVGAAQVANAGIAGHVVISEIYPNAENETGSEWIELYNPTDSNIGISGWTIGTPTSPSDATIPEGSTIKARSFFLIADTDFSTKKDNSSWPNADHEETISFGNTNSWAYLNNSADTTIDTVGWGSEAEKYEGSPFTPNPSSGKSLQRKDNATQIGTHGPAWDTDDNSADFFIQDSPNPQNSGAEPVPPLPELPSIVLFAFGLLVVAMYMYRREAKRREGNE